MRILHGIAGAVALVGEMLFGAITVAALMLAAAGFVGYALSRRLKIISWTR